MGEFMADRIIINSIEIENLGRIKKLSCNSLSGINLIIGENGSGKTFLLKALYSAIRTTEEYKRGDDIRNANDILAEKLRWTFQTDKLGDIVTKSGTSPYIFKMNIDGDRMEYRFSRDTTSAIKIFYNSISRKEYNSVFVPAKEVLSLYSIILKSREIDHSFGFDDTYYDLTKALRIAPKRGKNFAVFAESRTKLKDIVEGKVELDESTNKWYYKSGKSKYTIGATSEGIKKIAILDRLLANGYIGKNSVIFIDELESALHPKAISEFIDMLYEISVNMGIQIFIASHSYFVIKKLFLLAQEKNESIKSISINADNVVVNDLADGMPDNAIIEESIRLYEEEIEKVL